MTPKIFFFDPTQSVPFIRRNLLLSMPQNVQIKITPSKILVNVILLFFCRRPGRAICLLWFHHAGLFVFEFRKAAASARLITSECCRSSVHLSKVKWDSDYSLLCKVLFFFRFWKLDQLLRRSFFSTIRRELQKLKNKVFGVWPSTFFFNLIFFVELFKITRACGEPSTALLLLEFLVWIPCFINFKGTKESLFS